MQMTLKEFRHLAQGAQSLVVSGAVIAVVVLAWHALKTYQQTREKRTETDAED